MGQKALTEESESAAGKQVIARAAAVLRTLAEDPSGMSLGQISKATGLPRTTVHRLVASLEAQLLVASGPEGVRLGPALVRLAATANKDIVALARPSVELLGRRTRETVDVCVQRGPYAISVDQYACEQELRVVSPVGTAFPIHTTAHGKALLSDLPDAELRALLPGPLEQRTDATVKTVDALIKQMNKVRRDGYAIDIEEHVEGVCGIGVVLRTGLPERYAISLAVPALRFSKSRPVLTAALLQCKTEIETLVGT